MPHTIQNDQTITGVLERIIYFNEENAYCVAEVQVADSKRPVTVLGALPGVQCGETLRLDGHWARHSTHGDQFKIAQFKSQLPASVHGIRKYLGSGLIHGIGKSYAKKIVDHFGSSAKSPVGSTRSPASASSAPSRLRPPGTSRAPCATS